MCAEEIGEPAGNRIHRVARNDIGIQIAGIAVPEMLLKIVGHRRADEHAGARTFERAKGEYQRFPALPRLPPGRSAAADPCESPRAVRCRKTPDQSGQSGP